MRIYLMPSYCSLSFGSTLASATISATFCPETEVRVGSRNSSCWPDLLNTSLPILNLSTVLLASDHHLAFPVLWVQWPVSHEGQREGREKVVEVGSPYGPVGFQLDGLALRLTPPIQRWLHETLPDTLC